MNLLSRLFKNKESEPAYDNSPGEVHTDRVFKGVDPLPNVNYEISTISEAVLRNKDSEIIQLRDKINSLNWEMGIYKKTLQSKDEQLQSLYRANESLHKTIETYRRVLINHNIIKE